LLHERGTTGREIKEIERNRPFCNVFVFIIKGVRKINNKRKVRLSDHHSLETYIRGASCDEE
jgi:hypothetical protein